MTQKLAITHLMLTLLHGTEVIAAVEKYKLHGIGYLFTEANGIVSVDLDKCIMDGKLNEVAIGFLKKAPRTYIEIPPSGKGLRALLRGKLPPECGKGKKNNKAGGEMYTTSHYFTMRGNKWRECADDITEDNGVLKWLYTNYIKLEREPKA